MEKVCHRKTKGKGRNEHCMFLNTVWTFEECKLIIYSKMYDHVEFQPKTI